MVRENELKKKWKKSVLAQFERLFRTCLQTEKKNTEQLSGYMVSDSKFEIGISRIQGRVFHQLNHYDFTLITNLMH